MAYVDLYCERLAPGLLAEPLNAATNLAFFAHILWHLINPLVLYLCVRAIQVATGFREEAP